METSPVRIEAPPKWEVGALVATQDAASLVFKHLNGAVEKGHQPGTRYSSRVQRVDRCLS